MYAKDYSKPDIHTAAVIFNSIRKGESVLDIRPLRDYILDRMVRAVESMDLPIAVHTGVWSDFRTVDPKHTIYLAENYPGVHFDLFHLGMPMTREAAMIGKNYRNISLNLCWCPIVSERMTAATLEEIIGSNTHSSKFNTNHSKYISFSIRI